MDKKEKKSENKVFKTHSKKEKDINKRIFNTVLVYKNRNREII